MASGIKHPQELKDRAVRLALEVRAEEPELSWNAVYQRIGPKVGISPDTLRTWVRNYLANSGELASRSSADAIEIKELRRRVKELERANEILKAASAFFARELDPQPRL